MEHLFENKNCVYESDVRQNEKTPIHNQKEKNENNVAHRQPVLQNRLASLSDKCNEIKGILSSYANFILMIPIYGVEYFVFWLLCSFIWLYLSTKEVKRLGKTGWRRTTLFFFFFVCGGKNDIIHMIMIIIIIFVRLKFHMRTYSYGCKNQKAPSHVWMSLMCSIIVFLWPFFTFHLYFLIYCSFLTMKVCHEKDCAFIPIPSEEQ